MTGECVPRLVGIGISEPDAYALRRIAMTLHRWHELECGDGNGCIERDEQSGRAYWLMSRNDGQTVRFAIPDRERGAHKRLAAIMKAYPQLTPYVQGDPRGAALYILRPEDMIPGARIDSFYSRGVAVYR